MKKKKNFIHMSIRVFGDDDNNDSDNDNEASQSVYTENFIILQLQHRKKL